MTTANEFSLDGLLRRIRKNRDFPAFSAHVREIAHISAEDEGSANDLAAVILKDHALTQKILKLSNGAHLSQFAGSIHTISRAVVILGFEQIRSAALGLILFEHFQKTRNAEPLLETMLVSIFSGLLGKAVTSDEDKDLAEEIFICALLHDLGKVTLAYYEPDLFAELKGAAVQRGEELEAMAEERIGLSLTKVGEVIAREWGFPSLVVHSLTPLPKDRLQSPASLEDRLKAYSEFANALTHTMVYRPKQLDATISGLLEDYQAVVSLDKKGLGEALKQTQREFESYMRALPEAKSNHTVIRRLVNPQGQIVDGGGTPPPPEPLDTDHSLLMDGISDISETLLEPFDLSTLLVAILESLYSALPTSRVILFVLDKQAGCLRPRFGFADNLEEIRQSLTIPTEGKGAPFADVLQSGKEMWVEDTQTDPRTASLPDYHHRWLAADSFGIFPLMINAKPIGVIYLDSPTPGSLDAMTLRGIKTLVKQTVMAIRSNR